MKETYIIDIDGTICKTPTVNGINRYDLSLPIEHRIDKINKLYDSGYRIIYWTSRGASTDKDWAQFTIDQLVAWGCKFHECKTGKPSYTRWIDDKAMSDKDFFNDNKHEFGFDREKWFAEYISQ